MSGSIDAFRTEAIKHRSWFGIDIKSVLVKRRDGSWLCVLLRAELADAKAEAFLKIVYEGELVRILVGQMPVEELAKLLEWIKKKEFVLKDPEISASLPCEATNLRFYEAHMPYEGEKVEWPLFALSCSGKSLIDLEVDEDRISRSLKRSKCSKPYDDLVELSKELVGTRVGGTWSSSIQVLAPLYAKFEKERCSLSRDMLNICVRTHKVIDPTRLWTTVLVYDKNGQTILRESLLLAKEDIPGSADECFLSKEIKMKETGFSMRAYLFLEGIEKPLDTYYWVLQGPERWSARVFVHNYVDPDFEILKKWLSGEGKRQHDDFVKAVLILLYLGGFSCEDVGGSFENASLPRRRSVLGVDLVATDNDRVIILGQCVTGSPAEGGKSKMEALAITENMIGKALTGSKKYATVLRVIFTSLKADWGEFYKKEGARVVCYEDLVESLEDIRRGFPSTLRGKILRT